MSVEGVSLEGVSVEGVSVEGVSVEGVSLEGVLIDVTCVVVVVAVLEDIAERMLQDTLEGVSVHKSEGGWIDRLGFAL